jgi:hypothetical protein
MNLRAAVIVSGSSVNPGGLIGDDRAAGSADGSDDRSLAGDEDCLRADSPVDSTRTPA